MNEEIVARFITIERDGAPMRAYHTEPPGADATTPTVVMAMHLWGIDAGQREVAERLARAGFATIVPDLYARFDAPDGDASNDPTLFVPLARSLSAATIEPDILAAAAWLRARHPQSKTAILGFCMGGTIAMVRASGYAQTFAAAAIWYGYRPDVDPAAIDIPLVASYGADDAGIPLERIEELRRGLRVPHDIKIYAGARHGFFDRREAYEPQAAEDSWARSIAFLRRFLCA